jgi:hypothetical protein
MTVDNLSKTVDKRLLLGKTLLFYAIDATTDPPHMGVQCIGGPQ